MEPELHLSLSWNLKSRMAIQIEAAEPTILPIRSDYQISGEPLNFGSGPMGWLRAGTSFLAVLTLVLIGIQIIFALYRRDLNDPDIWWHMRNAQYLLQNHHFPNADMYSFTVAGHTWMNHEWLAEMPYFF